MRRDTTLGGVILAVLGSLGVLALAVLALLWQTAPARAQGQCFPRAEAVRMLAGTYHETVQGMGMAAGERFAAELWVSRATGTWTLTLTSVAGITCFVASGSGWEAAPAGDPA